MKHLSILLIIIGIVAIVFGAVGVNRFIDEVDLLEAELEIHQTTLAQTEAVSQSTLLDAQKRISQLEGDLFETTQQLQDSNAELAISQIALAQANSEIEGLHTLIDCKNPTYAEMLDFLTTDKTSDNKYITGEYVCWNFAMDVNNAAEIAGWRCGYCLVGFEDGRSHSIIVFDTTDRGLVYIDPQGDKEVSFEVGDVKWVDSRIAKWGIIW